MGAVISPNIMAAALKSARWNEGYRWTAYLQIAILLVCIISLPLWKKNEVQEDEKEAQKAHAGEAEHDAEKKSEADKHSESVKHTQTEHKSEKSEHESRKRIYERRERPERRTVNDTRSTNDPEKQATISKILILSSLPELMQTMVFGLVKLLQQSC